MSNWQKYNLAKRPVMPSTARKMRTCLRCRKEFMSRGPENRICEPCNDVNCAQGKHARSPGGRPHGTRPTSKGGEVS